MFRKRVILVFITITVLVLSVALYASWRMEARSLEKVAALTEERLLPLSNDGEKFAEVRIEVDEVRDIDLKRGQYTLSSFIEVLYDPKEILQQPDFGINNATVINKQLLKNEVHPDGRVCETYYLLTSHNFVPIVDNYPLDWQVLRIDMVSKNPFDPYSFNITKMSLSPNVYLDSYTLNRCGTTMQATKLNLEDDGEFVTYLSRGYILIEHSDFLFYLRSFQMMLVSVILALVSFLSISDNARYGSIMGALFVSMGNIASLLGRIREGNDINLLDISSVYYLLVIVGILIIVSMNSRNRHNLEAISKDIDKLKGETDVDKRKTLVEEKSDLEVRIKKMDYYALISLNVMFWGYFFGAYVILR